MALLLPGAPFCRGSGSARGEKAKGFVLLQHRRTWGAAVPGAGLPGPCRRAGSLLLVGSGRAREPLRNAPEFPSFPARRSAQPGLVPARSSAAGSDPGRSRSWRWLLSWWLPGSLVPGMGLKTRTEGRAGFDVAHVNPNVGGRLCLCDFSYGVLKSQTAKLVKAPG